MGSDPYRPFRRTPPPLVALWVGLAACSGPNEPEVPSPTPVTDTAPAIEDTAQGPLVYVGFVGEATFQDGTYAGTQTFGFYELHTPAAPDYTDATALCEWTWTVATAPEPNPVPCAACAWDVRITLSDGHETADAPSPSTGEPYTCEAFGVDGGINDGAEHGYGYQPDYLYDGEVVPALLLLDEYLETWTAVGLEGVTYDAQTGAFTYLWVSQLGYLP